MDARPLYDRPLVGRLEDRQTIKSRIIIPDAPKEKARSCEFLAAGSGNALRIRGRMSCFLRQQHAADPARTVNRGQSAFRCARCGAALRDLDEAGYGSGYVDSLRRLYERRNGVITRTSSWDTEEGIA